MKKLISLVLSIGIILCISCGKKEKTDSDILLICKYSDKYMCSTSLIQGVKYAETECIKGKKDNWRDDSGVLANQKWVKRLPGLKEEYNKWGKDIYASIGDYGVTFITARWQHGYMGSPRDLAKPETNIKYCCEHLTYLKSHYNDWKVVLSVYNWGSLKLNKKGQFYNQDYVDNAWKVYVEKMPGGFKEE